jgi:Histidine kinase-, DNA gyrase B-, and HSP90-like ATPase.
MTGDRISEAMAQFRKNQRAIHKANGAEFGLGSEMRYVPTGDDAVFEGVDATPEELLLMMTRQYAKARETIAVLQRYALAGLATEMTMHEVNSRISWLRSYAEHFSRVRPDDRNSASLKKTVEAISNDFDFLSRFKVSSGRRFETTAASIMEVLQEQFGQAIGSGWLKIETTDAFEKAQMWIDPRVMHAVMINLVRNSYYWASKDRKKAVVRIDAERIEHEVDIWDDETETSSKGVGYSDIILVSDNGPGLPSGKGDELFDPGVSGRGSSGIGLHICRTGLESNGYTIIADEETAELGGAQFRIGRSPLLRPETYRLPEPEKPREISLAEAIEGLSDLVEEQDNVEASALSDVYEEAAGLAMRIRLRGAENVQEERLIRAVDEFHAKLAAAPVAGKAISP